MAKTSNLNVETGSSFKVHYDFHAFFTGYKRKSMGNMSKISVHVISYKAKTRAEIGK